MTKSYVENVRSFLIGQRCLQSTTYQILSRLEWAQQDAAMKARADKADPYWLMPYRKDLRTIYAGFHALCNDYQVETLRRYMAICPRGMTPICVFLLGKCADRFRLYQLDGLWNDPSPVVRRQVAKALRRLEAWSQLEEMAREFPDDDRVRWYATALPTHRSFAERLSNFVESVDDSRAEEVATPSQMPYWARDNDWSYTPPKGRDFIRRILRRIRHWVRWGAAS